ncbi:GNAT family N-acetyltransferase [Saccharicrinis aurantiacus]|uniref:GNAT family N-acetyltransferase n=1 Tax=Saccharicrinis aurantiacus TaxID=1849719 RepID=UPI0009502E15|nr:GNAT family N-acetyltransferase [Saccharicrinis aurantiacus]
MSIVLSDSKELDSVQVIELYKKNNWSSADKPNELLNALKNSHGLISAWDKDKLVGLANAISDGFLVVYYPHLLILPDYQGKGIGRMIMDKLQEKYKHFHQQILVADGNSVEFYAKCGFEQAGKCTPMWIYKGAEHD